MPNHHHTARTGRRLVWIAVLTMAVLHQDWWWWDSDKSITGLMPIGMEYHVLFSLVIAGVWVLAVLFAWPTDLEAFADEGDDEPPADQD